MRTCGGGAGKRGRVEKRSSCDAMRVETTRNSQGIEVGDGHDKWKEHGQV